MSMTLNIMHTEKLFEVTNSSIFRTMKNSLTIGEVRALIEPHMTQNAFALLGAFDRSRNLLLEMAASRK